MTAVREQRVIAASEGLDVTIAPRQVATLGLEATEGRSEAYVELEAREVSELVEALDDWLTTSGYRRREAA